VRAAPRSSCATPAAVDRHSALRGEAKQTLLPRYEPPITTIIDIRRDRVTLSNRSSTRPARDPLQTFPAATAPSGITARSGISTDRRSLGFSVTGTVMPSASRNVSQNRVPVSGRDSSGQDLPSCREALARRRVDPGDLHRRRTGPPAHRRPERADKAPPARRRLEMAVRHGCSSEATVDYRLWSRSRSRMMSARSPGWVIGTLWFDAMSTNARSGPASTTACTSVRRWA
jgi:hypothetical protein